MYLNYSKDTNSNLFNTLEKLNLFQIQNYIPIYNLFFNMNSDNCNFVNLEIKQKLLSIEKIINYNCADAFVSFENNKKFKKKVFFKYAPIIDPIRYMAGKYKDNSLLLPQFNNKSSLEYDIKTNNPYNSAYIDAVFTYISCNLFNSGMINALNFHGMFIGYHKHLKVNIIDDLEFLTDSSYFHNNLNTLFEIENDDLFSIYSKCSGKKKQKLKICDTLKNGIDYIIQEDVNIQELNADNLKKLTDLDNINELHDINFIDNEIIQLNNKSNSCSSASSLTEEDYDECSDNTDDTDNDNIDNKNNVDNSESTESSINSSSEENSSSSDADSDDSSELSYIEGIIHNIPVTIICMEKCTNTLDNLMESDFNTEKWISCLLQIIFTLILYQKKFKFTHNDLHTSNIMYVETDNDYLYYKFNDILFKVPTYGKVYKIIDFGRSIYEFNNMLFYSDAFNKKEDAATQYNFGPFYNNKKPEVLPNMSFDLCRLACSLYDYFDDYTIKHDKDEQLVNIIKKWCTDDKGKNMLYKSNGEERYPEFKLYKMISRTVHHCVPSDQLNNELFTNYICTDNTIQKNNIIDIDEL